MLLKRGISENFSGIQSKLVEQKHDLIQACARNLQWRAVLEVWGRNPSAQKFCIFLAKIT